jgi:hypothetical protein
MAVAVPVGSKGAPSEPKEVTPVGTSKIEVDVTMSVPLVPVDIGMTAPLTSVVIDDDVEDQIDRDEAGVAKPSDPVVND